VDKMKNFHRWTLTVLLDRDLSSLQIGVHWILPRSNRRLLGDQCRSLIIRHRGRCRRLVSRQERSALITTHAAFDCLRADSAAFASCSAPFTKR
jgi:hypothetical protein